MKNLHRKRHSKALIIVVWLLVIGFLQFAALEAIIAIKGNTKEYHDTKYVIVLGAGVWGMTVSPALDERLKTASDYLQRYPDSIAVVSGGQGKKELISEAEAMKRYLVSKGIDAGRIVMEDRSSSTMENFKFSRVILDKLAGSQVREITVITSNFHMFRSRMLAERNGFTPYCVSSKTPFSVLFYSYFREYFALIKSYLVDR